MTSIQTQKMLDRLKADCLVFDIETSAHYSNGTRVPIGNFDDYVTLAKVKWVGLYSHKYKKSYYLNAITDSLKIKQLISEHKVLVGFNSEEFDYPIMENNGFIYEGKKYIQIDCMQILGKSTFKNKKGYGYKDRGTLMGYKFKNNKLSTVAEEMKLDFQKGEIDYEIFEKNEWTDEEKKEIIKYLHNDVMATKQMLDKLWNYWMPFVEMLDDKHIKDYSWIRNSIASLTYKSACHFMGIEPTYSEKGSKIEEMGGRVIMPKYEEMEKVWYIDFASLYPHIFCMFNLFNETEAEDGEHIWNGNEVFKTKGKYNIEYQHPLSVNVKNRLKERILLKDTDPDNPMIYTLKIWLNALYGCARSAIFEQVHTENCGWDCCWLGQQIQQLTEEMMDQFGFETVQGDTDSLFVIAKKDEYNNREYVQECLDQIIEVINDNVPFPVDTFKIDIEKYIEYLMCPFSDQPVVDPETGDNVKVKNRLVKERKGKKKNYMYLYKDGDEIKIKLVGLPIKKDNATALGMKIFDEFLSPKIIETKRAKFEKDYINNIIQDYLAKPEIMQLLSREYKIKPASSYKKQSQIQAQISVGYFDGGDGIIRLIKNNKIGKAGKGDKYCTIEEAVEAKLTSEELDLEKVWNELEPFIIYRFWARNVETDVEALVTPEEFEACKEVLEKVKKKRKKKEVKNGK